MPGDPVPTSDPSGGREAPTPVDLLAVDGASGVVWSASPPGFHANLVALGPGGSMPEHRNDEVDVLVVALAGSATITVDGRACALAAGSALVVPRGSTRSLVAGPGGVRYLSVHGQRRGLSIGPRRRD